MVDKFDIFFIIKQTKTSPPVQFPESIISGFGFPVASFLHYDSNSINFTEINSSDAKCIQSSWCSRAIPYIIKRTPNTQSQKCTNLDISKKNIIYQRFLTPITGTFVTKLDKKNIFQVKSFENSKIVYSSKQKIF